MNQSNLSIQNDKIWCPLCQSYTIFLKVPKAAKIADVDRRTVYRYIESGAIYAVKVAGKTIRVCGECLIKR